MIAILNFSVADAVPVLLAPAGAFVDRAKTGHSVMTP
jgi:hypothetical protein